MADMTLIDVRDWHRKCATMCRRTNEPALAELHDNMADALDAHLAGMGEPEFKAISDHWVHRGMDSLPCYCWAGNDHAIGNEKERPAPPASADVASLQSRLAAADALLRDVLDSYCASPQLHARIAAHLSENTHDHS